MPANDKAAELAKKAAIAGGGTAWELVKKGMANKAVKKAAIKAGEGAAVAVAGGAAKNGNTYLARRREERRNRRLAFDLAKQIGGSFSVRTVIAGSYYVIVWRGEEPIEAFPPLPEELGALAERPELKNFQGVRQSPTPKAKAKDAR